MQSDPFAHLGEALKQSTVEHRATIPTSEMPALFKAVAKVPAELVTKLALSWLNLTARRTGAKCGLLHGVRSTAASSGAFLQRA
jgi:hypothetical protein